MLSLLLAQAVICGQYGSSPASVGGCYVPYPNAGGGAYLQQVQGQVLVTPIQPGPGPVPYQIWNQPTTTSEQ